MQQQKNRKVQQKIKMMMKNKKLQKLVSEKDIAMSQKPISINNDKYNKKYDQYNRKYDQYSMQQTQKSIHQTQKSIHQTQKNLIFHQNQDGLKMFSNKRFKSSINEDDSNKQSLGNLQSKYSMGNKAKSKIGDRIGLVKTPSLQKIHAKGQSNTSHLKLKRPSSVINKSTRSTTFRNTNKNEQKLLQQKVRSFIQQVFIYGIKLQKFTQQKGLSIQKEREFFFNDQINIIRLINCCKKYYTADNQEELEDKMQKQVEKEIIQNLKKKIQRQNARSKCDWRTTQITNLIQNRLNMLQNKSLK